MTRRNPSLPPVSVGKVKRFGPIDPKYDVGNPLREAEDGDWFIEITLVDSAERVEYKLSNINDDPDAD